MPPVSLDGARVALGGDHDQEDDIFASKPQPKPHAEAAKAAAAAARPPARKAARPELADKAESTVATEPAPRP